MKYTPARIVASLTLLALSGAQIVSAADTTLNAPYQYHSVQELVIGLMRAIVLLALPVIALFIVIAGFKFVAAQGNETKISEAKDNLKYVIYGATLILGAWVLATLIGGTVKQVLGAN